MNHPEITLMDALGELPRENGNYHVRQFDGKWWVRLSKPWPGSVAVLGDPLLHLSSADGIHWRLPAPKSKRQKKKLEQSIKAPAGIMTIVLTDAAGRLLPGRSERIEVLPASLELGELEQILEDLGLLALAAATYLHADIRTPTRGSIGTEQLVGATTQQVDSHFRAIQSLLDLAETVTKNWTLISQRPLAKIDLEVAAHRELYQVHSPQSLLKAKIRPRKRAQLGLTRVVTMNCSENQFLCYILDYYLDFLASGFITLLDSLSIEEIAHTEVIPEALAEFAQHARLQLNRANSDLKELETKAAELRRRLERHRNWARRVRSSSFLRQIATPQHLPPPTQRLLGSPGYAAVAREFYRDYTSAQGELEHALSLCRDIRQGKIRATWELYEIWCLAKLYSSFLSLLGLKPDGPSLFRQIRIRNGVLAIPRNHNFTLTGRIKNGPTLNVDLYYERVLEKNGARHRPDIMVDISIDGKKLSFVFDAKYRNYFHQGIETIIEDVEDTARDKYLKRYGLTGAFILHSDGAFDYWGETSLREKLRATYNFNPGHEDHLCVGHTLGAIRFRPRHRPARQVEKMLSLMFQYHGRLMGVCLHCARKLEPKEIWRSPTHQDEQSQLSQLEAQNLMPEGAYRGLGVPLYCLCAQCARLWVIQHCVGEPDHLILKTGELCLHQPSSPGSWWYRCPVCGS